MGNGLEHVLDAPFSGGMGPRYRSIVRYGKCARTPYAENELWFVTVYAEDSPESLAKSQAPERYTFLVREDYAQPAAINERRRDLGKWRAVARLVFSGEWCENLECLWKNVPVYSHTLPNGSIAKYGYCRTQSLRCPERELWFVSFRDALFKDNPSTFVVDSLCTTHQFLDRMGNDNWKWMVVCWCRLENEVAWDKLESGTLEGGYVRSHDFALDSPALPFRTDDIIPRVTSFEDEVSASRRRHDEQHRGFLERRNQWRNLTEAEQIQWEVSWRRQACEKIRGLNTQSPSGLK